MTNEQWLELDWKKTPKQNLKLTGKRNMSVLVYQRGERWKHMIYHRQPVWSFNSFETAGEAQLDALFQIRKAKINPADLFPQMATAT